MARVSSADASKDVNRYLPSSFLVSTVAAFHLPGVVWSDQKRSTKERCPLPLLLWKLSELSLLWHWPWKTEGFPCLAFAISGGGIFCHVWGANEGWKSRFRILIYKIFTPQSYRSSVKLQMKWKIFCDNKTLGDWGFGALFFVSYEKSLLLWNGEYFLLFHGMNFIL